MIYCIEGKIDVLTVRRAGTWCMFDLFLVGIHSFQQLDSSLLFAIIAREAVERKRPGWFADERACMLACLRP